MTAKTALSNVYARRAIDRLGVSLDPLHRRRALAVADCLAMTEAPLRSVLAAVWPDLSLASARRAIHRLRAKIAAASAASGWPLSIEISGRGAAAIVRLTGKCPEFTSREMGVSEIARGG